MSTLTSSHYEIVAKLPPDTVVIFHDVAWEEYEELLVQVGEPAGLHISFNDGTLEIMTVSAKHEKYVRFFETLITAIRLRWRINILSFGSATMKAEKEHKGNEPDACFYVRTAALIGNRVELDFGVDPPPDIAVEVDVHHQSLSKFPIYVALKVPELWRFDGREVTIHLLEQDRYLLSETSLALPMLTASVLTEFLTRLPQDGEFQTLSAFDEWLQSRQP